jgi:hypothetical protein
VCKVRSQCYPPSASLLVRDRDIAEVEIHIQPDEAWRAAHAGDRDHLGLPHLDRDALTDEPRVERLVVVVDVDTRIRRDRVTKPWSVSGRRLGVA